MLPSGFQGMLATSSGASNGTLTTNQVTFADGGRITEASGIFTMLDGSGNVGFLQVGRRVVNLNSSTGLGNSNSSNIYYATGQAGQVTYTLPASAPEGTYFSFIDTGGTGGLKITAQGADTIQNGGTTSGATHGFTSNANGSTITMVKLASPATWYVTAVTGTWTAV